MFQRPRSRRRPRPTRDRFRPRVELLERRLLLAAAYSEFIDPNPAPGNQFGHTVLPLRTGNVVITSPFDDAGGTDSGAVYLFNGATGGLISTLTGISPNDEIGIAGVTEVGDGNFVISSPSWDNGSVSDAGAVTFGNGSTGVSGTVSPTNSIVGSRTSDHVGNGTVIRLANGNYVLSNSRWNNSRGAATFGDGQSGVVGVVSSANSLVGSAPLDRVGIDGVVPLENGNYVVRSLSWSGTAFRAGAVTFGDGTVGVSGIVSATNSLVGSSSGDIVGNVVALPNGDYVIHSVHWDNGATVDVGAVTFANGSTGISGTITSNNSLLGRSANDRVGHQLTILSNGNFVVSTPFWDRGSIADVGAATFIDATIGTTGFVTSGNSLVGDSDQDQVGNLGVTALTNGNYVVASSLWNSDSAGDVGAVTFANGKRGITGDISRLNSLVGSLPLDRTGHGGVVALENGNYVVSSPFHNDEKGAAIFGNGMTGITGPVSRANSLYGDTEGNNVGRSVVALPDGNYLVLSPSWDGVVQDLGAVTLGDGETGTTGPVSSTNSLVGSSADDRIGTSATILANGNYVIGSSSYSSSNFGAATFGDARARLTGSVSPANSITGSSAGDHVGSRVVALHNGNYVVHSGWSGDRFPQVGAATFGDGFRGTNGFVSPQNSFVGSVAGESFDSDVIALPNGNYLIHSPNWTRTGRTGKLINSGATTFGNGTVGTVGVVDESISLVGEGPDSGIQTPVIDEVNGYFYVPFLNENGGRVRVGSMTDGLAVGTLGATLVDGQLTITDTGHGFVGKSNRLTIGRAGDDLVIHDTTEVFESAPTFGFLSDENHTLRIPLENVSHLHLNLSGQDDTVQVDQSTGLIGVPISIDGGNGIDRLNLFGDGTMSVDLIGGADLGDSTLEISKDGAMQSISLTGFEPLTLNDFLNTSVEGSLNIDSTSLQIIGVSFTDLGQSTTLSGDAKVVAAGGLHLGGSELISAEGIIASPVVSDAGSTISLTGNLELGDGSFDAVNLHGRLNIGDNTVNLLDGHKAVLGSQTTIGHNGNGGNLLADGGVVIPATHALVGEGVVGTTNNPTDAEFENQGFVQCNGATGLTFNQLVTGAGDFGDDGGEGCTFLGGTDFGNSPNKTRTGSITFGETNTHNVEIGGRSAGTEYDQVDARGMVRLGGELGVQLIDLDNGYAPTSEDHFDIITSHNVLQRFAAHQYPLLPDDLAWNLLYFSDRVALAMDRSLDLRNPPANYRVVNLEQIDVVGLKENELILDGASVIDTTDANQTLVVVHNEMDEVNYLDGNWDVLAPIFVEGGQRHALVNGQARVETINTRPWQNPLESSDVDFSGKTTAGDALRIINFLGRNGSGSVPLLDPTSADEVVEAYYDVNGSGNASAVDALNVINALARQANAAGESVAQFLVPNSDRDLMEDEVALTPQPIDKVMNQVGAKKMRFDLAQDHYVDSDRTSVETIADRAEPAGDEDSLITQVEHLANSDQDS